MLVKRDIQIMGLCADNDVRGIPYGIWADHDEDE
jgi:hypothetical protein